MTLRDLEGGSKSQSVPGFIYDQHYWEINPTTGEKKLRKPFEPNTDPDLDNNDIPDGVQPGNPTGSYLFPALISALRQRRSLG